jgi:cation/acetate symporter
MVSLAFAIAASANFPALLLSVLWKNCTTRGAYIGGFIGLATALILTVLSEAVWVDTLGNPAGSSPFPYASPAIFSMPIAFIAIWLVSVLDHSAQARRDRELFADQKVRSETGIGAARASSHNLTPEPEPGGIAIQKA